MKNKNIFWGIIFLIGAGVIIANQLGAFDNLGVGSFLLTFALVLIIVNGVFNVNFFQILVPLSIILIIYAEPLGIDQISSWTFIVSGILASIGLSLIFKKKKKNHNQFTDIVENLDEDIIFSETSFSGVTKYLQSKNLKEANFNVRFGGLNVYFDQVTLSPEGATINIDASFAGVELHIPKNWNVVNNISAKLGGVDVKGLKHESTGPTLYLEGNINLSGVEINYI